MATQVLKVTSTTILPFIVSGSGGGVTPSGITTDAGVQIQTSDAGQSITTSS